MIVTSDELKGVFVAIAIATSLAFAGFLLTALLEGCTTTYPEPGYVEFATCSRADGGAR